jgi:hypothetical protein
MHDLRHSQEAQAVRDKAPSGATKRALVVVGMHRSGTSATAGALGILGAALPRQLMPAIAGVNEAGFFEPSRIVALHDELLSLAGSSWHDLSPVQTEWFRTPSARGFASRLKQTYTEEFGAAPLTVLKDPRLCRLLPIWLEVLRSLETEPVFLLPFRHPAEVAASLSRRDGFSNEKSQLLWLQHFLLAEAGTRRHRRAFVAYEELLTDPIGVLARVGKGLSLDWPRPLAGAILEIKEFLGRRHQHNRLFSREGKSFGGLLPIVAETYSLIESIDASTSPRCEEAFDRLRESYLAADRLTAGMIRNLEASTTAATEALEARQTWAAEELAHRDAQIVQLKATLSEAESRIGDARTMIADFESRIADFKSRAADSESRIADFESRIAISESRIVSLGLEIERRGSSLDLLQAQLVDQSNLHAEIARRDEVVAAQAKAIGDRDELLAKASVEAALARDVALNAQNAFEARDTLSRREVAEAKAATEKASAACAHAWESLGERDRALTARDDSLFSRDQIISARDAQIERLLRDLDIQSARVRDIEGQAESAFSTITALRSSSSWRLTAPLRALVILSRRVRKAFTPPSRS